MKKLFLLFACMIASLAINAQDKKVAISSATASSEQSGEGAALAIDGDLTTIWHSNYKSGTTFPVTFTITFDEPTHVDYVRYTPRQSGDNGNWNEVYMAYSTTTTGESFINVNQYTLNGSSTLYDFMMPEGGVECGQIRFTISSGAHNYASAAEIEAYVIDKSKQDVFAQYFTDDLFSELKPEVTSSEDIEDEVVKRLVDSLLSNAEAYKKFRVGEYEPYMPTSTLRNLLGNKSLYNNYENPTGIYLNSGESCYVVVSGVSDTDPIKLTIKSWYINERSSTYSVRNGLNYITATSSGNVFVNYYTDNFENAPNVKLHFINAPVQGYWNQETMTNEDWKELLKGRSADDHTILITQSKHAQLAYPVSAWLQHCPENIDSTMTMYQQVQWAERDILGLEKYGLQCKNRQLYYATNYGFMAAGGEGAYCNYTSLGAISTPDSKKFDFWGVGHEWGHNNQIEPGFHWSGCGETTNNIYAQWAQFHFTGNRDASGHPTSLRLEDEVSGIDEYSGMRGGRMQTYFEEGLRKGVAWQLQDGPDYHGTTPDTKTVAGYNADGNPIGDVTTTSRNYDHFVKLVPFWQLNLWGTLAGKCPDIIPMVIQSIRTTPDRDYGMNYNTNGKEQINWMKLACDSAKIDLLPFFEKAGMLRPIHAYIEDYGAGWNIITEEMIAKLKAYVKEQGYPAFTEEINYINGHNYHIYRDNLKLNVPETLGEGCSLSGNKVTVQHNTVKNAVAFETYNFEGKLLRITMYGLGSDDSHATTQVLYPQNSDVTLDAAYIMAVGYDGTRTKIYEEDGLEKIFKKVFFEMLDDAKVYQSRTDTTGTKIGFLNPDSIVEYSAFLAKMDSLVEHTDADANMQIYEEWYYQLKEAIETLSARTSARIPLKYNCFYSLAVGNDADRYLTHANAGLRADENKEEEMADKMQWKFIYAGDENTCYIQHRTTGNYITTAQDGQRVKAESMDIEKAVAFTLIPDAPGEFILQRADNDKVRLYTSFINSQVQIYAGNQNGDNAKWIVRMEDDMLALPDTSTDKEIVVYYLQRTDNGEYAYCNMPNLPVDRGRIATGALKSLEDTYYWFYFKKGSSEEEYTIYNYGTGMAVTENGGKLYLNSSAETTPEFKMTLDEQGTGFTIATDGGQWTMKMGSTKELVELSAEESTSWKLQRSHAIDITNAPLTSLTISKERATLVEGDSIRLTVTTAPVFAADHSVKWSSSDEKIATVDSTGLVIAIAEGEAVITATANDGSGLTATCQLFIDRDDSGIDSATSEGLSVESKGSLIIVGGLSKGTEVSVYNVVGKQIAAVTTADGTATIETGLPKGSIVIIKTGEYTMKIQTK